MTKFKEGDLIWNTLTTEIFVFVQYVNVGPGFHNIVAKRSKLSSDNIPRYASPNNDWYYLKTYECRRATEEQIANAIAKKIYA